MKKYFFVNHSTFLLAIAAIFCFTSCFQKSEQQIRAEVEKEVTEKFKALLQTPKHVLSAAENLLVMKQFQDAKLHVGDNLLATLEGNREVYFSLDKLGSYDIFVKLGDKKQPAQTMMAIPVKFQDGVHLRLKNCFFDGPGCFIPDFPKLPAKLEFHEIRFGIAADDCLAACVQNCQAAIFPKACQDSCLLACPYTVRQIGYFGN